MKMAILMDARAAALMGKKPPQRKLPARLPCIVHALCGSSITGDAAWLWFAPVALSECCS